MVLERVRLHTTKGHVRVGLHHQDQEHLRLAWLHQHKRRRSRDCASMLGRPRTTIQPVKDDNLGERNPSFGLQPSINIIG